MFSLNCQKHSAGFTLLELTISIGIFMMIGGMVMVNFRAGQYSDELQAGAKAVENAVREAQAAAIGGQEVCVNADSSKFAPLGGFGLNIAADNTALWFGDCDYGTDSDNDPPRNYVYSPDPNIDVIVQNIDLGSNIKINTKTPADGDIMNLVFSSGSEVAKINGSNPTTVNQVVVTLEHKKTAKRKTVVINLLSGQVFIE